MVNGLVRVEKIIKIVDKYNDNKGFSVYKIIQNEVYN